MYSISVYILVNEDSDASPSAMEALRDKDGNLVKNNKKKKRKATNAEMKSEGYKRQNPTLGDRLVSLLTANVHWTIGDGTLVLCHFLEIMALSFVLFGLSVYCQITFFNTTGNVGQQSFRSCH